MLLGCQVKKWGQPLKRENTKALGIMDRALSWPPFDAAIKGQAALIRVSRLV
jgi:hypothetical protein